MWLMPLIRWKLGRLRPNKPRFFLLMLIAVILCLSIAGWKPRLLEARDIRTQSTATQNLWQYASFPVENFRGYTSPFGYRISPVDGSRQFHQGLDIAAPLGSYVRNWWTGKIAELSDHTACGTLIKIQSGAWQHIYCHLMGSVESTPQGRYLIDREGGILLWQGQEIPVGARIARVGMTGRTTGPHLHWGLLYGSNYVDPALVLREMFKNQAVAPSF